MLTVNNLELESWKKIVSESSDPIAFIGEDCKFIFCNNAWSNLLGYTKEELLNMELKDVTYHGDLYIDKNKLIELKNENKEDYYIEKRYVKKDNTVIFVKLYIHKYNELPFDEGYVLIARQDFSKDYEDLKSKFLDLQKDVLMLCQDSITVKVSDQLSSICDKKCPIKEFSDNVIVNKFYRGIILMIVVSLFTTLSVLIGTDVFYFLQGK